MDLFANALNDVVSNETHQPVEMRLNPFGRMQRKADRVQNEHTTKAFEAFWKKAELEEMGKQPKSRYLNINPEGHDTSRSTRYWRRATSDDQNLHSATWSC